ncbi:adenylyl-sulfate kinase [Parashewanella spongiae]|uniref:Adenylyl-sulfate kinase n=1 Tax=Parashewanella spongiae TaxID=342950 RepID=A0A3A6TYI1_9GAMM|nr:adenylyl-sulfate kinase [Parashewanella spongiae]MCL1077753.1 adenylyl-sulfate kinase [Parashewanella spongiae]RJY18152.1 adenylyl-sulfate kinase [Parashewanella spongiae]
MSNIGWHSHDVDREQRSALLNQTSRILWFTGLSGSGKSTLAGALEHKLHQNGKLTYLLDGDNIRHGLCHDLGFSETDRNENIRRITEVSKLMLDAGLIVLAAFVSPSRLQRQRVREQFPQAEFIEVHVSTPLEICEQRDPKGLYQKARAGEIKQFTGIDAPYEAPLNAELTIDTSSDPLDVQVNTLVEYLESLG